MALEKPFSSGHKTKLLSYTEENFKQYTFKVLWVTNHLIHDCGSNIAVSSKNTVKLTKRPSNNWLMKGKTVWERLRHPMQKKRLKV